jgi:hypothetical protein
LDLVLEQVWVVALDLVLEQVWVVALELVWEQVWVVGLELVLEYVWVVALEYIIQDRVDPILSFISIKSKKRNIGSRRELLNHSHLNAITFTKHITSHFHTNRTNQILGQLVELEFLCKN